MPLIYPPVGSGYAVNTSDLNFLISISGDFARKSESNTFTQNNDFNGDVTIRGNLIALSGTHFQTTEHLLVTDNFITVNNGELGAGVSAGTAGMEVDRGTLDNYYFEFDETSDSFKIGLSGSLQKVATREDNPLDVGLAVWNDTDKLFETTYTTEQYTTVPASCSGAGMKGQLSYESGVMYFCIADNTWVKTNVTTSF